MNGFVAKWKEGMSMNDRAPEMNDIRRVMDACLPGLEDNFEFDRKVIGRVRGEVKVKKKLSVGLALAIVLILAAITALAAIVLEWRDAAYYLQKESSQSPFQTWTSTEKSALVSSLVEDGAILESEEVRLLLSGALNDDAEGELAERIMMEWLAAPVDHVAFRPIVEKIWGAFSGWTLEQKAWYTQTLTEAGIQSPDMEMFVLPENDAMPQQEAEAVAITYAELWMGVKPGAFAAYPVISEYVIFPDKKAVDGASVYTTEGQRPVWFITLTMPAPDGSASAQYVEVDPVSGAVDFQHFIGRLLYDRFGVDWEIDEGISAIGDLQSAEHFQSFFQYTLEEKARWSEKVRDLVLAKERVEPDFYDMSTRALTRFCYGLPGESAMQEEAALGMAKEALGQAYGLSKNDLAKYNCVYSYYDVTDARSPIWRSHLSMQGRQAIGVFGNLYDMTSR
jgi:hypothetical protein